MHLNVALNVEFWYQNDAVTDWEENEFCEPMNDCHMRTQWESIQWNKDTNIIAGRTHSIRVFDAIECISFYY